jgi:hypothetical protein
MNNYNFKLLDQLLEESEIMAQYALGSGIMAQQPLGSRKFDLDQIMEDLVCSRKLLSTCRELCEDDGNLDESDPGSEESDSDESQDPPERRTVEEDCKELTKTLSRIHGQLAQIVKPALPQTLRLIHEQTVKKKGRWSFWGNWKKKLGPVPLVQNMVITAIISLIAYISFSVGADAFKPSDTSMLITTMDSLADLLVLLCAAGLGASYLALYSANRFVVEGTYDPKYNSSYWIRFVLGLISGVILAEVISQLNTNLEQFGKDLLALIGGFSASVVYRILTRLVEAVESIFMGDESERIAAQEQASRAKLEEQNAQERLVIGADLMQLSQKIGTELDTENTKKEINKIFDKLMPFDTRSN